VSVTFYIGLVLSAAIGLSLGLIGGGGSILTVPILVYFFGVDTREAVGMSLAVVGATSTFGAILHYRRGTVDFSKGMLFGVSGIVGAFVGSPLTHLLPPNILLLAFAGLMFAVAFSMLWRRRRSESEIVERPHTQKAIAAGFVVGVLTGFLGVGGGFLIVPALVFFGGLEVKEAIGTSLLVIALNCFAGILGHLSYGLFDIRIAGLVTLLAVLGAVFGTVLSYRFSVAGLQRSFAFVVLAVAIFLTYKNI
jgi:uncharacterized membrane protein YfcA